MFAVVLDEVNKQDSIQVKVDKLDKCMQNETSKLADKNCLYHPVECSSCRSRIGKYYLLTNKRMARYSNKICLYENAIRKNQSGEISHSVISETSNYQPRLRTKFLDNPSVKLASFRKQNYTLEEKGNPKK